MADHPSFTFTVQNACEPKAVLISDFVAVRVAGATEGAEIFVSSRTEAQAFIDVFTEARDMLPEENDG